ncbi:hypothetical protein TYRP_012717 [Tyrophagus putrescentiae]|nr:hypothetical protein TYRP_012717 [Tyrophagus putrescentiae]
MGSLPRAGSPPPPPPISEQLFWSLVSLRAMFDWVAEVAVVVVVVVAGPARQEVTAALKSMPKGSPIRWEKEGGGGVDVGIVVVQGGENLVVVVENQAEGRQSCAGSCFRRRRLFSLQLARGSSSFSKIQHSAVLAVSIKLLAWKEVGPPPEAAEPPPPPPPEPKYPGGPDWGGGGDVELEGGSSGGWNLSRCSGTGWGFIFTCGGETISTDVALEGPLAGVRADVNLQRRIAAKDLAAVATAVATSRLLLPVLPPAKAEQVARFRGPVQQETPARTLTPAAPSRCASAAAPACSGRMGSDWQKFLKYFLFSIAFGAATAASSSASESIRFGWTHHRWKWGVWGCSSPLSLAER